MTYILLGVALVVAILFFLSKKSGTNQIDTNSKEITNKNTPIDTTQDTPVGFGYKCTWIAVKSTDQERIAKVIGLHDSQKSNWKSGIEHAYNSSIFISPAIDDWTLIIGYGLPQENNDNELTKTKNLLNTLSKEFNEAQYFATHRVVEYHCWIKSLNGETVRVYGYIGESGENIEVYGYETEVEQKYKFGNTLSEEAQNDEDYFMREDLTYPDEEIVMEIAESWSINPTTLDKRTDITGLGIIGKLK